MKELKSQHIFFIIFKSSILISCKTILKSFVLLLLLTFLVTDKF